MISFKISIFALSNTTLTCLLLYEWVLWLALKLVSLHYQIQPNHARLHSPIVVISFKISIFALSNTTFPSEFWTTNLLWLALKLVSLHYQIQHAGFSRRLWRVVISFKISIFALSNTTDMSKFATHIMLWLALKLVSLHYQIQLNTDTKDLFFGCD